MLCTVGSCRVSAVMLKKIHNELNSHEQRSRKELGPCTEKLAPSISLKIRIVEYVSKTDQTANGSLLITCQ